VFWGKNAGLKEVGILGRSDATKNAEGIRYSILFDNLEEEFEKEKCLVRGFWAESWAWEAF